METSLSNPERPVRIRGKRFLVFGFDPDRDANWYVRLVGSELLAEHHAWAHTACTGEEAAWIEVPADSARRLVRRGVHYDTTTISQLAREADVSRKTMRAAILRSTAAACNSAKVPKMPRAVAA